MRPILTSAHKAAAALRRAETALRNWQDEPDSPRRDVDEMLRHVAEMRALVQGHLLEKLDRHEENVSFFHNSTSSASARTDETVVAEAPERYDHQTRDEE